MLKVSVILTLFSNERNFLMLVSVCIVAYNEAHSLPSIFKDLLNQTYSHKKTELVFIDNCSNDSTYNVLCNFAEKNKESFYGIKVLKSEKGHVLSAGLNLAIDNYEGEVYIRVDAHASLDSRFIEETVACLEGRDGHGIENVCGGMRPTYATKDNGMSSLLLVAEQSRFGASVASYRDGQKREYTDSVFHAAYRREVIDTVGYFNEKLFRTEDNEYNRRVEEKGYKICFEPKIKSSQQIRESLPKMLKQKYQNGFWIGYTLGICPRCIGKFHLVPLLFLLSVTATSVLGACGIGIFSALLWGAYGLCNIVFTAKAIIDAPKFCLHLLLLPVIFLLMHICYGVGTFVGIVKMLCDKISKKA